MTVEELRATLKKVLAVVHDEQVVSAIEDVVDSLIAAAEARVEAKGREEGAEQERSKNSEAYRRTHIGLEWDKMPVPSAFQEGDYVVDRKGFRGYVEDTHGQLVMILDENNPDHHCGYDVDSLKLVLAPATKEADNGNS